MSFHDSLHASTKKSHFEVMHVCQITFPMELRTEHLCHKQKNEENFPDAFPDEEDDGGLQQEVEIIPDPSQEGLLAHFEADSEGSLKYSWWNIT